MNEFLSSDASYNVINKVIPKVNHSKSVCIGCLRENVTFVNLSTCKHTRFFEFYHNNEMEYEKSVVCELCHHFLKKIEQFRIQVKENLIKLNDKAQNLTPSKWFQNLQLSTSIPEKESLKFELYFNEDTVQTSPQDHFTELTTEVKIESYSDNEIDVPLSEIKKEISKKKKKKKLKKKEVLPKPVKRSVLNKYGGKIAIVTLTKEEMLEERQRDATKPSYLSLPYKCDYCITGFDHELTLKDHIEKRHGPKKNGFICDVCKSVLSTEISYKEHVKRHTRRYECQACGKRNNSVYSVVRHYNEQHATTGPTGAIQTEFTCADCGFKTESYRGYRYHRDKHKPKEHCTLCDSTFVNKSGLRLHMFTVHGQSSRVYSCNTCNKVYAAKSGLAAHLASSHASTRASYCAQCRTHFKSAHNLAHHLKTHSAHISDVDKRFICDECGLKFLTKSSLQQHIDFVHLKRGQHACPKCDKVFMHRAGLKKHVNFVHEKIRPPRNKICDHCGRGFTTLSILQSHVRTHTGERPLQCRSCPATFAHSAALYTHNKLLHNKHNTTLS